MKLGDIKNGVRTLNGSPLPTRWTDQLLANLINQASNQLVLDASFPEGTMAFQTNPPPATPTLTYTGAAGSTQYGYAVVAVAQVPAGQVSGGGDSIPSPIASISNCAATLTAANYVAVTFASVVGVTYKIIRQTANVAAGLLNWSVVGTVVTTNTSTTVNDQGASAAPYIVQRGNEFQLPQLVKLLRVYLADAAGDKQPLVPTDIPTMAGIVARAWDQCSTLQVGAPQYTPKYLAETPQSYPVPSPFGKPALTSAYQYAATGTQRPEYYLRGGFIGIMPPPVTLYTVMFDYIPQPPTLVQNGDQSLFPDNFLDCLCWKVLEYIAIADETGREDGFRNRYIQDGQRLNDRFMSNLQGDKPRSLDPNTIRTEMREWSL